MTETKVKIGSIVQNQLPDFVKSEFPLVSEFLSQYYLSLENQGSPYDLIQKLNEYVKVDTLSNLITETTLSSGVDIFDSTINVDSTAGFPDRYGLIQIDSEIITYTSKTSTTFDGCIRGFSGITSLNKQFQTDELEFSSSRVKSHTQGTTVKNLSVLFLQEFFIKLKTQVSPGFEDKTLYSELNEGLFVKQSKDFYSSKGTDNSFEILFRALYGKDVEIIKPRDYLIIPSFAEYRITTELVVEPISGNIEDVLNNTVFQDNVNGVVTKVERLLRGEKEYYQLSLDYNDGENLRDVFGSFKITPKTKVVTSITDIVSDTGVFVPSSTTIDVDSTAGFANSGELIVYLENGTELILQYGSKTLNQFLDCTGIDQPIPSATDIRQNEFAYSDTDSGLVKFYITGVLSDVDFGLTRSQNKNYPIKIKSLGKDLETNKANNWFFNVSTRYDVKSIELKDNSSFKTYQLNFYDEHSFVIGDQVILKSGSDEYNLVVTSYVTDKAISASIGEVIDVTKEYEARKNLSRVNSTNYPELSKYTTNVQNIYVDGDDLYVTSPSLPTYLNQPLNIQNLSVTFSGPFSGTVLEIGNHPFYTGDSVYYESSGDTGIESGYYFIKKVSSTEVSISRSRPDIISNKFISADGEASNDVIVISDYYNKLLEPQKLIRKLSDPSEQSDVEVTEPGMVGLFINGVEVLNYKSNDLIYYGSIQRINVLSSGSGYDVINPPVVEISDSVGTGATAYASVVGSLKRIDILDGGFDYVNEPTISISGGNGFGASAKANLISFDHFVRFNASSSTRVDTANNTISFSEDHKFRNYESVIYDPKGQSSVGGLTTNSQYVVSVEDSTTIKLYKNKSDSVSGINTISLTSLGTGSHYFKCVQKKQKIGSISIENPGFGYSNNKTVAKVSGINTSSNTITIENHGYSSGDILTYETTGTSISGLSTTLTYYVSTIDEDNFKLSHVGLGTITKDFYSNTGQFIDLKSTGSGLHIFNYEPIVVSVSGVTGISTLSGQDFNATVQPIFRGSVKSVFVEDGGSSYGNEEIVNHVKQPGFNLNSGSGAVLIPVINGGKIVDVVINYAGSNYNSPPDLVINGSGFGAVITPNLSNGTIASVNIISSGSNYLSSDTTIDVLSAGKSAKLEAHIQSWRINLVERYIRSNKITNDDGFVSVGLNKFGLQYTHPYVARKLRSSVLGTKKVNGKTIFTPDLVLVDNKEILSTSHSPIIGWAYDGNPIYGPYGHTNITGGPIKIMQSGYKLKLQSNRPSTSLYPSGFFVEDYQYYGTGDLDEHNGRFCVTPEYPNGVYAYFSTINDSIESSGAFKNYRKPSFPYVIGNSYKSRPIEYNFLTSSNQDNININATGWLRSTNRYNLTNKNSGYDFVYEPYKIKEQKSTVTSVSTGNLTSVGIESGGFNYQVGDVITFERESLSTIVPKAEVSFVNGKLINSISIATSSISNVELYKPVSGGYVAIATVPHGFKTSDKVFYTTNNEFDIQSSVGVSTNKLSLSVGVGSAVYTGIVTYFSVSGNLSDLSIQENDFYLLGNEQVKILNVDRKSSRIRVLRNQNGTTGLTTNSAGDQLVELPRRMSIISFVPQDVYEINDRNKEYYFSPREAVGLGTTSGVGIGSTLYFANPGAGITQIDIPTRSIYLPSHGLESGVELIYSSNGGTGVSISTNGVSSWTLPNNSIVYSTKLTNDLIGISTFRVGLNSTGTYVGLGSTAADLLYFTGLGVGNTHSFTTNYENVITGDVFKNEVTVSTASTHGLSLKDTVFMNVKSGVSTTKTVTYSDYNRRMVVNPRSFVASGINTVTNTITISDHGYFTGQKVIHTSSSPSGGLEDQKMYYVVVVDSNTIKLSDVKYFSTRKERNIVDITSTSTGNILPINPPISLIENQTVVFDVSDSSLRYTKNSINYSAFELNFYRDHKLTDKFEFSNSDGVEVVRSGNVGVDSDATVTLTVSDTTPRTLYYTLDPVNIEDSPEVKRSIFIDEEVGGNNQISIKQSSYSGEKVIVGISSTSFRFITNERIESPLYDSTNSTSSYYTNSKTAYGSINGIKVSYPGRYLTSVPKISSITSGIGTLASLNPVSDVGSIQSSELVDFGFDYPSDLSLRPTSKAVSLLSIAPQSSFKSIGVSSVGKNYYIAPSLIVLDGITKKQVTDVQLNYTLGNNQVEIFKNTKGLNNQTPTIIPINNVNGVNISNISFNSSTNDVTVTLGSSFSDAEDYPFAVGDKVLIENVSVGVGTTSKGYNSSQYEYSLFTITSTDPNIGGIGGTVTYNMSEYLTSGEVLGTFDSVNSAGRIIPEKHFPIFDIKLTKNSFFKGEKVYSNTSSGEVIDWDPLTEDLKLSTTEKFNSGDLIIGNSSKSQGIISSIEEFDGVYTVSATSKVRSEWETETGFLNNNFQRIHDNDYYQYFSYEIKSEVPYDTWKNDVNKLNHTAGFKEFSNLVIETTDSSSGMSTSQNDGDFSGTANLSRFVDLNCVYNFDLVSENNITIDGKIKSNQIIFNSRILQDYIESIGNRVLIIDDISDQFNDKPRSTKFSVVDSFDILEVRSLKYLTYTQDKLLANDRRVSLFTLIHDGSSGYLNEYSVIDGNETYDIGYFDFNISGSDGNILFYPYNSSLNEHVVSFISFDIKNTISGVGSTNLGDSVFVGSSTTSISSGTSSATTVVGIASTYRSSKVLVQIGATDSSYFEFDELTLIHDGSNIIVQEYGQLNTTSLSRSTSGFGTYYSYYSGSNINVDLIPYDTTTVGYDVNSVRISIASTLSTGIGTEIFTTSKIDSNHITISSSPTPGITTIATYSSDYEGAYYIVSVEDTTNNRYQVSEVVVLSNEDDSDVNLVEFGIIETNSSIGSIGATFVSTNVGLTFTPKANINVQVKVFQKTIGLVDVNIPQTELDLSNAQIRSSYGSYTGTSIDVRRSFNLTHNENPIFERCFDGSDSSIVDVTNNTISLPEHFFVTGEKVLYSYDGSESSTVNAIGIATTTISGISTNKMPSTVYIVKDNDLRVRVSASASEALLTPPVVLNITSVGIGSSHLLTSTKQNSKVLIGIDNVIQSPISDSSIETTSVNEISIISNQLTFSGITSFFSGDLVKIDDEIMRINSVGVGSTNRVFVQRPWMGTGISTHAINSTITKVQGSFNIVGNEIHFASAPYGLTPIGSTTNPPDERDWTGISTYSTFSGRSFMRSGITSEPYTYNYIFDDISHNFNGVTTSFTMKSSGSNISGFSTSNSIVLINDIFQGPARLGAVEIVGDYDLGEASGITSVVFTGSATSISYDVNNSGIPRGGIIVSVGSSAGLGYQPLVSAGGTAIVSGLGTISSISIGNSGSGYRSGIQTVVNVGVGTSSTGIPNIEFIGTAAISGGNIVSVAITNPGSGYTTTNPPYVFFDAPLSYSDISLVYSSGSSSGVGTEAKVDIVVGQGSSVISFEFKNLGYGYKNKEILTVEVGGTTGIPTDTSLSFEKFQITIDRITSDNFSGWSIGDLQVIDPLDDLFDGTRKDFPIKIDGEQTSILSRKGSNIDVEANLLIFINDVLQVPGGGYTFKGGSVITFAEAPKVGDKSKVLFYKGTGSVDTQNVDILELVEVGDDLRIDSNIISLEQDPRIVYEIVSTDVVQTNSYPGPGISNDKTLLRPVILCRQTEDRIIGGNVVSKKRRQYEPFIQPTSNIISNVSTSSTQFFVESVKTFFDSNDEYLQVSNDPQKKIVIISQDEVSVAIATATVSGLGTISSIEITDGGVGYTTSPTVTIASPVGLGTTQRASATATISVGGTVSSITVSSPGTGYTSTNPPVVLIEQPGAIREVMNNVSYEGDFGIITGVNTTSVGVASTGIVFDLFIPRESFLRDLDINPVGIATTGVSGIQTGYYFVVYNSNIGHGVTSLDGTNSIVGVGSTFLDNIYHVSAVSIGQTQVIGYGVTYVAKVTVSVSNYNGLTGLGYSGFFGEYSWGRIYNISNRPEAQSFTYYNNGILGVSTSPTVQRYNSLKYINYST